MTDEEVHDFLSERHTMNVASIGRDGRPHLVAMWYGFFDGAPAFWTYGKSQKVINLRRDPRLTCLVEAGSAYKDLVGVELIGTATILEDWEDVLAVGRSVYERYTRPYTEDAAAALAATGAKRVGVRVDVKEVVSWDHRKLGGKY